MMLRTAMKMFVPAVGIVTLGLLLSGISGNYFARKPRLNCESSMDTPMNKDLMPILNKLKEDAQQEIEKKKVKDISLYFRELKSGAWVGINKDEKFNTASLLKVPLMMECLEKVESHPGLLKKRLLFTGEEDWDSRQYIKPRKTLEPGSWYTVDELMLRMIAYSDNNATQLLLKEMPLDYLYQYLADHKIDYEKTPNGSMMSLDTYSRFFEALYDKSLLNSAMSRKALSYLAVEDFPQGMHAAVPANIAVESKFGEQEILDTNGKVKSAQLHEVGIVLAGNHPFLLGIMTKGNDFAVQEKIIREITHDVYEEIEHTDSRAAKQKDCMSSQCHA
jgi:beta-lactamase class A